MASISKIIKELRRRDVFRTGVAYLVVAWLLVQISDILLGAFAAPAWALRAIVFALAVGFPVILVLAWVYEITTQGIKRTAEVSAGELISPHAGRQIDFVIIGVLLVAVALFAADKFRWIDFGTETSVVIRSIAVLPLANLSGNPEQEYFVDGMTEALTAELGQIQALKVISRTSAMRYKTTDKLLPTIARELGVDALLEGSVLRVGNEVRITLQLIHGPTDRHLWARSFQRDLQDILSLQSEVARTIADDMQITLTPSLREKLQPAAGPTQANGPAPEAYEAYLKGRYHFNSFGEEAFRTAIRYYRQAFALDSTFALAYAALAEACMQPPIIFNEILTLDDCEAAALKAVELDDQLAEAHAVLGFIRIFQWDWAGSEAEFKRALELNPNSAMAHQWYSGFLRTQMRSDEALREIRRAEELDPLNLFVKTMVGWPLFDQRRYDEALAQIDGVLAMNPDYMLANYNKALVYIMLEMPEEVLVSAGNVAKSSGEDAHEVRLLMASAHALEGKNESALEILAEVERDRGKFSASWVAWVHLLLGNEEEALSRLEKGFEMRSPGLIATSEPQFDVVRDHPRFQALRRKMGLP